MNQVYKNMYKCLFYLFDDCCDAKPACVWSLESAPVSVSSDDLPLSDHGAGVGWAFSSGSHHYNSGSGKEFSHTIIRQLNRFKGLTGYRIT